jgi:hypothetical protein
MRTTHKRTIAVFASIPALAFGGVGLADAAKSGSSSSSGSSSGPPPQGSRPGRPAELTGDAATKAKAAALAAVPGTVEHASKAPAGGKSGAAYAVFVKAKAGGRYIVLEDSSFTVLSKATAGSMGARGGACGPGMGGKGGPPAGKGGTSATAPPSSTTQQ